ncbi:cysteine-rich secretory protein family domain-containing protein [Ditylenchus destructor]|nr:cysteine-rich secretory protein family domain-containing protein [Ditylenchus destructor]
MLAQNYVPTLGCAALTNDERQVTLSKHNELRSTVAKGQAKNPDGTTLPTGSSIYGLKYNTQLETTIQKYVDKCIVKHSPPEERYGGENTGENLFYTNGLVDNTYALQSAMKWWWGELAEFGFYTPNQALNGGKDLKCNPIATELLGHFTNMAWETTREVGCAVTQCKDQGITLVACNYSPGGNWVGHRVYVSGPPCTATSGCTNTPASTCDVSSGLCFEGGVSSTAAPPKTSSTKPPTSGPNSLTTAERQEVTSVHNSYRSTLAKGQLKNPDGTYLPSGSSIYGLKYSESIEAMAQNHVAKCVVEHMTYEARNGFGSTLFYSNALINNTLALQYATSFFWNSQAKNGFYNTDQVFTEADWSTVGGNLAGKRVYVSGPPCTASSGCTNTPASTCDVPSSLCFVGGVPLTAAERQVVTSVHNNYRSTLAKGQLKNPDGTYLPSGSSIYGLKYNANIEATAQTHVAKCVVEHMTYEARNGLGTALYYANGIINNTLALQYAMSFFWNSQAKNGFYNTDQVFTQEDWSTVGGWSYMAWETTREIGCGVAQCPDQGITLVNCLYSPSGNEVGKRVYVSGPPCTATSGCTNTPASTCNVSSGLCFV